MATAVVTDEGLSAPTSPNPDNNKKTVPADFSECQFSILEPLTGHLGRGEWGERRGAERPSIQIINQRCCARRTPAKLCRYTDLFSHVCGLFSTHVCGTRVCSRHSLLLAPLFPQAHGMRVAHTYVMAVALFQFSTTHTKVTFSLGIFFSCLAASVLPAINIVFGEIIDAIAQPDNVEEMVNNAVIGMLVLAVVGFTFFFLAYFLAAWSGARIANDFRLQVS